MIIPRYVCFDNLIGVVDLLCKVTESNVLKGVQMSNYDSLQGPQGNDH